METQQDFKDLLELFNSHKVDYLIVGGPIAVPDAILPPIRDFYL